MNKLKAPLSVKCNCGHSIKDHCKGGGWCNKCGCTFYYPNDKWILKNNKTESNDTSN